MESRGETPHRDDYLTHLAETVGLDKLKSPNKLRVDQLIQKAELVNIEVVAGLKGLGRIIDKPKIQKPGLALAGFLKYLDPGRVQVLGRPEMEFLEQQPAANRKRLLEVIYRAGVACFLITRSQHPFEEMIQLSDRHEIPLLVTPMSGGDAVECLLSVLEKVLAPRVNIHGNFD